MVDVRFEIFNYKQRSLRSKGVIARIKSTVKLSIDIDAADAAVGALVSVNAEQGALELQLDIRTVLVAEQHVSAVISIRIVRPHQIACDAVMIVVQKLRFIDIILNANCIESADDNVISRGSKRVFGKDNQAHLMLGVAQIGQAD